MVFPIFVIEWYKDSIDGVEERLPEVVALVCWALCEDGKFTKEYFLVGQQAGVLAV